MIFYFTGTGNSLYAAKNLDSELVSIPQIINCDCLRIKADKIGIVCPIYGHEMPSMVKTFIHNALFETDYLYVVLTNGKRHANAVELAEQALKTGGKKADYITTLLMVDNFLPVFDMAEEIKLDKSVEDQFEKIKADIATAKRWVQQVTKEDRAAHEGYMTLVNNPPETVWADFKVTEDCIGCGICTKVCPAGCVKLEKQQAFHAKECCQACYACIQACPETAIQLNIPEKNKKERYRNPHIALSEIVASNHQDK